jgi:alkylhydroperoxidase/carboxymuconolactone decarboxylase family protein YurZ
MTLQSAQRDRRRRAGAFYLHSGDETPATPGLQWCGAVSRDEMDQVVRYQEILRKLAIIDDGFVEDPAGLGLGLAGTTILDPRTAALVQVGALAAIGSPAVCLEWGATRALAAGATEDEITDVLLAIAPVAGLARVVTAVPGVADAFGYDIEAALEDVDDY